MNNKEQLCIEDNQTVQVEQGTNLPKLSNVHSLADISSKSTENIDDYVEIASTCVQISMDIHDDEVSCQSDQQVFQNWKKSQTTDIGTIVINENLMIQSTINKDISNPLRSNQATELNDDYLKQMIEKLNDRDNALYEGAFLKLDVTENLQICSNEADEQCLVPMQKPVVTYESKEANNNKKLDKLELIVKSNDNTEEKLHLNEKPMIIDAFIEKVDKNGSTDENNTCKQDLLPSKELLIVDQSNSSNDITEITKESSIETSLTANNNENQLNNEGIPVDKVENINLKKVFSQSKLKDMNPTVEYDVISRIQHMNWLKPTGSDNMEINRRKFARKSSIEKDKCNEDIKEELDIEDTKIISKSNKKRSSQFRNRKIKAADSSKQDSTEDRNKKSSSNVGLTSTSKNETPKCTNTERFKDTRVSQLPEPHKIFIGRGRSERRKILLWNSQSRGQSDVSDQRSRTYKTSPGHGPLTMIEKNFSKNEAHSNAQDASDKAEIVKDITGNITTSITLDSIKSKEQKACEIEIHSGLHNDVEFLHNQSTVETTAENIESSSIQESKDEIDKQLPSEENYQESQITSGTNLPCRPIYGRLIDKNNSDRVQSSVKEFVQNTDEAIKNQPFQKQNLNSKGDLKKFLEQVNNNQKNGKHNENKISQSFSEQEHCSKKTVNSSSSNFNRDIPRWNYNNYPDKQNVKSNEMTFHKGFTSNKHRIIVENEHRENEELCGKNQLFTDKKQGSKRYSDKCQDSKTSVVRYFDRNRDNNSCHNQASDKSQEYKNYAHCTSSRNQDSRSYCDIDYDRLQDSQNDRYFDKNQNIRGFGGRPSGDRYSDKNKQSQTSSERFYNRKHDENQIAMKKQESLNKNSVGFDKNENCSNQNQIALKSLDTSSRNQEFPDKNGSLNSKKVSYSRSHLINDDMNENDNAKSHQPFNKDHNSRNPDASNNIQLGFTGQNFCQNHHEELDKFSNNFCLTPEQIDWNKEQYYKSDVKSQKQHDNTQQAKVKEGLNQIQQSHSIPYVACQQELFSSVDQVAELHGRVAELTDTTKSQQSHSEDWNLHKNTLKPDAVHSTDFRNALPYSNANMAMNPALANEDNLQYNQTFVDSSNHFSYTSASEQKPRVVMAFSGNQNVQRALGMDPNTMNQSQSSRVNNSDPSRSSTINPAPSQPVDTSECAAQFFQSLALTAANSQSTLAYAQSAVNLNAPLFEVTKQSNQQMLYAVQPTASNHRQGGFISVDNDCVIDVVRMNEISNNSEEFLKLHKEISELSKQLALKQAQLLALQIKLFKAASTTDTAQLNVNQQTNPSIQSINNQRMHEQNQNFSSSYVQVNYPNCPPPGFGDVFLNAQRTQMNRY